MGFWGKVAELSVAAVVIIGIANTIKNSNERSEENKRRKNTICDFDDVITKDNFRTVAIKSIKKIRHRKIRINVDDGAPIVYGIVESQSGLNEWSFTIDFNDYGEITGKYWITSENNDSTIPQKIADLMQEQIETITQNNDEQYDDDSTYGEGRNKKDNVDGYNDAVGDDLSYIITEENVFKSNEKQWTWSKVKKLLKRIFAFVVMTFFICTLGRYILHEFKKIEIEFDSTSFVGAKYETVINELTTIGFDNINLVALNDLSLDEELLSGLVDCITIDGKNKFSNNDEFLNDAKIIIYYHSLKLVTPPIDSKSAKGEDYNTIKQQFEDAGFVNIKVEIIYDLILGWFTKDGEVEMVTINSDLKFDEHIEYRPDAEVIITYHTYKHSKQ